MPQNILNHVKQLFLGFEFGHMSPGLWELEDKPVPALEGGLSHHPHHLLGPLGVAGVARGEQGDVMVCQLHYPVMARAVMSY